MTIGGIPIIDATQGSPAQISTTFLGVATGTMASFGVDMTDELAYKSGFELATYNRDAEDITTWNMTGLPLSISLNKVGWYVATNYGIESGSPYPNLTNFVQEIGGVYDGATLIDPDKTSIRCVSTGGNFGEVWTGGCSAIGIRIKNADEGKGDLYNIYFFRHQYRPADGAEHYTPLTNIHIWPGAIEEGLDFIDSEPEPPGPEPPGGDETTPDPSEGDGYRDADPDDTSDIVPLPVDPDIGVTDAGFINVYNPAPGALQGLGNVIFPDVITPIQQLDVPTAIKALVEAILNQNLINYVIDVHVIPCAPVVGNPENIRVGFRDSGISAPRVTSDYVNIACGSLNIKEYYASFADYLATRSKLWLPFIGFVDVLPEFWQAGTISVDYKFNVIDGSFMAYIRSTSSKSQLTNSVIASYGGNACMHFPLTGQNYSAMVSGVVGAITTAATTGTAAAAIGGAASALNTIAQGGDVQQSNGYNSTAAILGVRTPYLMIQRAAASYPSKYKHDRGFPSNISVQLGNISGYTEIEKIDLCGIPLTDQELTELRGLLADGVYF